MINSKLQQMHTEEDIRAEFKRLDKICSVDSSHIDIKLNNAQKRLGSFSYRPGFPHGTMTVTISKKVLNDDDLFYDTVRHEYAHAVVFIRHPFSRHGHDRVWKAVCREVGCTPRATVKDTVLRESTEQNAKYKVTCLRCGTETYYVRSGNVVQTLQKESSSRGLFKRMSYVSCRKCGGREFTLTQLY